MLYPDPLLTQEEIDLITIPTKNGNPDFDLETERRVWVRPFAPSDGRIHPLKNPRAAIARFDRFMFVDGRTEVKMYALDTDPENGFKVIKDKHGNPIPRMVPMEEDPSRVVPEKLFLASGPQESIEFQLPRDRYIFEEYLLKCPRNASVDYIDGHPNNIFPYRFYIEDPLTQRKRKKIRRKVEQEAIEYVRNLPDNQLEAMAIFFNISATLDEGDELDVWLNELRYQLEKLAREDSENFLYKTKFNKSLKKDLLFAQALKKRVIISRGENGYFYVPEDGKQKQVQIGFTKEAVFNTWENDPSIYTATVRQSGFELYLGESIEPTKAIATTSLDALREREAMLDAERDSVLKLKEELKQLLEQARNERAKSVDPSEEYIPKTTRGKSQKK